MSTRSQLRFVDGRDTVAQVYRHSDGYPSGVIPDLEQLRDLLTDTGWHRGASYTAAQFIFLGKLRGLRFYAEELGEGLAETHADERLVETLQEQAGVGQARAEAAAQMAHALTAPESLCRLDQPYFLGGHGVEHGNIHGDEEYIYEVHLGDADPFDDGDPEWTVKVSKSRWDGGFESPAWETKTDETRGYEYGPDEDAWTEATWDYNGPLRGAVEKYSED